MQSSKSKLSHVLQPRRSEESPFLSNNSHLDLSYPPPSSPSQKFSANANNNGTPTRRRSRLIVFSILSGLLILLSLAAFNSDDIRATVDPDGTRAQQVGEAWGKTTGTLHDWVYGPGEVSEGGEEEDGMEEFMKGTGDDVVIEGEGEGEALHQAQDEDQVGEGETTEEQFDEVHGTNTAAEAAAAAEKEKEQEEGVEDGDSSNAEAQAAAEVEAAVEKGSTNAATTNADDDEFTGANEADSVDPYASDNADASAGGEEEDGGLLPIVQDFGAEDAVAGDNDETYDPEADAGQKEAESDNENIGEAMAEGSGDETGPEAENWEGDRA